MKKSERINKWFAVMHMLEKQMMAISKIEHNEVDSVYTKTQVVNALSEVACMVDQILSCDYHT